MRVRSSLTFIITRLEFIYKIQGFYWIVFFLILRLYRCNLSFGGIFDYFFSAAADVLCASFNEINGVFMADAGRTFAHILICN
jgi:hypothetical protein